MRCERKKDYIERICKFLYGLGSFSLGVLLLK